jgi:hypothetical protein
VGHADDDAAGERRPQVADQRLGGRRIQMGGRLVEQDDVALGQQRTGRGARAGAVG